jgi:hypothetical protein
MRVNDFKPQTTGADYEAVQIAATGPEIPVHS